MNPCGCASPSTPSVQDWAAATLADRAHPAEAGSVRGMAFFTETAEDADRLALGYLGESVNDQWRLGRDYWGR